ncbi:hypothetical protein COCNU_scaffold051126G000030 [Cocos nucifera]|nr:hypothetical protein [Cocos nucifera]
MCSAPVRGPGPRGGGAPYHPDGASRIAPPRGFQRIERHCKRAGGGMRATCAARPCAGLGRAAGAHPTTPRAGKPGARRADSRPGSTAHGRCTGMEGSSTPECGPRPCDRGPPYHLGVASPHVPPRGFQRTERHCKRVGGGMRVTCAARPCVGLGRAAVAHPTTPMGHPR